MLLAHGGGFGLSLPSGFMIVLLKKVGIIR